MQIFILILSSLISVLAPANLVADQVLARAVRSQFQQVEQLQVRLDNAPIGNTAKGKVDRLRIAGRGFFPVEDIRIDTLELETDPINVSVADLRKSQVTLQAPLAVGVRVVLREEDALRALRSVVVNRLLGQLLEGLNRRKELTPSATRAPQPITSSSTVAQRNLRQNIEQLRETAERYRLSNPRVEFLDNRRIQLQADVEEVATGAKLQLSIESGLEIVNGRQLQLVRPTILVDGQPVPEELVRDFVTNLAAQLNLDQLERLLNVRAQIFKLQFANNSLEIAGFLALPAGFKL